MRHVILTSNLRHKVDIYFFSTHKQAYRDIQIILNARLVPRFLASNASFGTQM
jgi:hypothetical protein